MINIKLFCSGLLSFHYSRCFCFLLVLCSMCLYVIYECIQMLSSCACQPARPHHLMPNARSLSNSLRCWKVSITEKYYTDDKEILYSWWRNTLLMNENYCTNWWWRNTILIIKKYYTDAWCLVPFKRFAHSLLESFDYKQKYNTNNWQTLCSGGGLITTKL